MALTNKQYYKICNSRLYVTIIYRTEFSSGKVEMKGLFLIEKYKKLLKLFKGVEIKDMFVSDAETGVVYIHTMDFFNTWLYLIGRKADEL